MCERASPTLDGAQLPTRERERKEDGMNFSGRVERRERLMVGGVSKTGGSTKAWTIGESISRNHREFSMFGLAAQILEILTFSYKNYYILEEYFFKKIMEIITEIIIIE